MKRTIDLGVADLGGVAIFVKVAECRNFSLAADQLGIGKATASDHVARLERTLGVRLLTRTTRSVGLTDAGALFLEHCQRVMSDMQSAFSQVGALRTQPKGLLRVSVPVAIGRQLIAPLVPRFLERYPEISLDLVSSDRYVEFSAESFDMTIRHTAEPNQNLMAWKLRDVTWYIVATRRYLKRHGKPVQPADLARHNCLYYAMRGRQTEWILRSGAQVKSVTVSGNLRANSSEVLREAVLGDTGIGLLPDFSCSEHIESGELVRLFDNHDVQGTFGGNIFAISPWTPNVSPKVRAFIDFLKSEMAPKR